MTARRSRESYGFVNWPAPTVEAALAFAHASGGECPSEGIADSREGGMECWLIVAEAARGQVVTTSTERPPPSSVRDVCITGLEIGILCYDAMPDDWFLDRWRAAQDDLLRDSVWGQKQRRLPSPYSGGSPHGMTAPLRIEAAVCIGATGLSLWDCARQEYWRPRPQEPDLTPQGVAIHQALCHLYGFDAVRIVLALDT